MHDPARLGLAAMLRTRCNGYDRWVWPYLRQAPRRRLPRRPGPIHVLLAIADHYEPKAGNAPPAVASARVARWVDDYPRQFGAFRDSDGQPPRHTFFYPSEEYEPDYLDALADLCRAGFGEVEIHLHHDHDTAANLRRTLLDFKQILHERHGLLARDPETGEVVYAFVHGNWALDNARPDGRWCGVNNELDILRETGCYADFTMPAAPDPAQVSTVNSLYYAVDDPRRPRSHERGPRVGSGPPPPRGLLMIQGPLVLNWRRRKWGLIPRVDNACIQPSNPASLERLDLWLHAAIQVPARPDWYFVKLHAHGALDICHEVLLGEPMVQFHQALADRARQDPNFHYHYVTAREMYNLVKAAEAGWTGSVAEARNYQLAWNHQARQPCPAAIP